MSPNEEVLQPMRTSIAVPSEYDLLSSVHAWIYPDIQPVPEITWGRNYGRVFTFDDVTSAVVITQDKPGISLDVFFNSDSISDHELKEKTQRILNLSLDTRDAIAIIEKDPLISSISSQIKTLRPYLADSPFEALIKSIIQQQVSYRAANVLTKRLVIKYDNHQMMMKNQLYSFPTSDDIITMQSKGLRDLGFGYKTKYILGISELVSSGKLNFAEMKNSFIQKNMDTLLPIRGIGEWTVNTFAIAGLGDFTVFPCSDLGIRNTLGRIYADGKRFTKKEVVESAYSWGDNGSLILYLLMCADVLGWIDVNLVTKNA